MSAPEVAWAVVDAVLVLLGGFCVALACIFKRSGA